MSDCEKYRILLSGLVDGELAPEESHEINSHLNRCENCRKEYENLQEARDKISLVSFKEPEDKILENLWKRPYSRFARNTGLFLVIGGWVALLFFVLYEIITSEDELAFPRIATVALFIGFFILLFSVIRERIKTYKKDPYKEVKR